MWLGLVLEEGIMQNLIVNVQLAHFRLHAVSLLLLQLLVLFLFLHKRAPISTLFSKTGGTLIERHTLL